MSISVIESERARQRIKPPFLTIGIPTWNRAKRLQQQLQAIASVLSDEIELVVCDNGSSDGTWILLEQLVQDNPYALRCVRNGTNLGADVNYLRVIEAASGQWLWFVGDDDPIDFSVLPFILEQLHTTPSALVLLLDAREGFHAGPYTTEYVDSTTFFQPRCDQLGLQFHQVGRMLCRVAPAQARLRQAHATGVGELHAYAMVYAPLLLEHGLLAVTVPLLHHDPANDVPRWNLIQGNIGAWKTSMRAFAPYGHEARARELRLRLKPLLVFVMEHLSNRRPLARQDVAWMFGTFDLQGRVLLLLVLGSFKLSRSLSLWLLSRLYPGVARRIQATGQTLQHDY